MAGIGDPKSPHVPTAGTQTAINDFSKPLASRKSSLAHISCLHTTPSSTKKVTIGSSEIREISPTRSPSLALGYRSSKGATPPSGKLSPRTKSTGSHTFPTYPMPRKVQSMGEVSPTPKGGSSLDLLCSESLSGSEDPLFHPTTEIEELKDSLASYNSRVKAMEKKIRKLTRDLFHTDYSLARVTKQRDELEGQNAYLKEMYENDMSKKFTTPVGALESPGTVVVELHKRFEQEAQDSDSISSDETVSSVETVKPAPDYKNTSTLHQQLSTTFVPLDEPQICLENDPGWYFDKLFESTLDWARRFTTLPLDMVHPSSQSKAFYDAVVNVTSSLDIDDILQSIRLRPLIIAAVINRHIVDIMSSDALDSSQGYECNESKDLKMINVELSRKSGRPSSASVLALLERQAATWEKVVEQPQFWRWVQKMIQLKVEENINMFFSMIPREMHEVAFETLKGIFKNTYALIINMKKLPKEWDVAISKRNDRWIHNTMDQKDNRIDDDLRLKLNHGFHYVIRFCIAPSISEKDYSTGIPRACQHHRQQVILMENPNPRREPKPMAPFYPFPNYTNRHKPYSGAHRPT